MSGAMTGTAATAAIARPTLQDPLRVRTTCFVAVAGAAARATVECRSVTITVPTTKAAISGSASSLSITKQKQSVYYNEAAA